MSAALKPKDVVDAYRMVLRRAPESQDVVEEKMKTYHSKLELFEAMLRCEEFNQIRNPSLGWYRSPPATVETHPTPGVMPALFERVQSTWQRLGEEQPHWSVITDDRFRVNSISEHQDIFYASGEADAKLLDIFAARAEVALPHGTCFELGCGVGRITRYLASRFQRLIAADVSDGNLRLAREHLAKSAIENVELTTIRSIGDFENLPVFDVFFSLIVLQHNSPPVQLEMLSIILNKIRPGGVCLFQTPSRLRNYRFVTNEYLATPNNGMEMHCLPMKDVLILLQSNGFVVLEVSPDNCTGQPGSFTYFARKET
jgi:2-polyprenyl-3-methyl-5-hydroxy-6-metoxy-1,4-benzoquinol methylase